MFTTPIRILFRRHDILAGVCLIIISYLPFRFPNIRFDNFTSLLIGVSFPLGVLLIANQAVIHLGGFSPLRLIRGSRVNNHSFTIVCIVFGAILEFVAADLGGLWYFPYWSVSTYMLIGFLLGGWAFYFLFLIVCYEAVKLALDKILPQKKRVVSYFHNEPILYKILFVAGIGMLAAVVRQTLINTHYFTQFHYQVNQIKPPYLTWQYWIITFFGLWFKTPDHIYRILYFSKHACSAD